MIENLKNRPKGRPLGQTNLVSSNVKKLIADIVSKNLETIQDDLDQMRPAERTKVIVSLLDYVSHKLRSVETTDLTETTSFKPITIKLNEN